MEEKVTLGNGKTALKSEADKALEVLRAFHDAARDTQDGHRRMTILCKLVTGSRPSITDPVIIASMKQHGLILKKESEITARNLVMSAAMRNTVLSILPHKGPPALRHPYIKGATFADGPSSP